MYSLNDLPVEKSRVSADRGMKKTCRVKYEKHRGHDQYGESMNMNIRHALVTDEGQGIGAAIAQELVVRGLNVAVLSRYLEVVQALVAYAPARMLSSRTRPKWPKQ